MTELTVTSAPELGLLDVSVYPPTGDPIEFALSSTITTKTVPADSDGRYVVVARRPNGGRLRQSAVVKGQSETILLADVIGKSSNEFMQQEMSRGEIGVTEAGPVAQYAAPLSGALADILGRAMLPSLGFSTLRGPAFAPKPPLAPKESLFLRGWRFDGAAWKAVDPGSSYAPPALIL